MRRNRTGNRLLAITNLNYITAFPSGPAPKDKVCQVLPILLIIAEQNKKKLCKKEDFNFCLYMLNRSIKEN